jgi:single-strand DNA-binding protein
MSTLRNSVQLIGNLGKAPEVKTSSNGNKYAQFSIATSEKYKNKAGELITETTWHNITVWGTQADIAEKYLNKGSQVGISAKLINNEYTDKDGVKKSRYDLKVMELLLLSSSSKPELSAAVQSNTLVEANEDGLPF